MRQRWREMNCKTVGNGIQQGGPILFTIVYLLTDVAIFYYLQIKECCSSVQSSVTLCVTQETQLHLTLKPHTATNSEIGRHPEKLWSRCCSEAKVNVFFPRTKSDIQMVTYRNELTISNDHPFDRTKMGTESVDNRYLLWDDIWFSRLLHPSRESQLWTPKGRRIPG